jgi:STE24 endopeptidase
VTPHSVLILYIIFLIAEYLFHQGLTLVNMRHAEKKGKSVPDEWREQFERGALSEEEYRRSVEYTLRKQRFGMIEETVSTLFLLAVVLSGALGFADRLMGRIDFPPVIHGIFYVWLVSLAFGVFSLPFSLYGEFRIEKEFGFSRMTPGLFAADLVKGIGVSAVLSFPLLFALFLLMTRGGEFWWVWGFIAVAAFQFVVSVLYPTVIAPLFNKFTPLEEGDLKDRLERLAERCGFRTKGIFVMDGSRRSGHSNAYFTGLGRAKRIVLFDTLLETLEEEEIAAVLAHEIGHEKLGHHIKGLVVSVLMLGISLFLVDLLMGFDALYRAFGFTEPSPHAILVILAFCSGPFTFFLKPLFTAWSRKHEYRADRYALEHAEKPRALESGLVRLCRENLSNIVPHPLYSFFHYSHPALGERVAAMEEQLGG